MEVLGALSGSLAVVDGAATSIRKTVKTLRQLKRAPQELKQLLHQVDAIVLVTNAISNTAASTNPPEGLAHLLEQLKRQLLELEQLIQFKLVKASVVLEVDRVAWTRHSKEVSMRLNEVSKTTEYISVMFSASMFLETTRVGRQLNELSLGMTSIRGEHGLAMARLANTLDGFAILCNHLQSSAMVVKPMESNLEPLRQIATQASASEATSTSESPTVFASAARTTPLRIPDRSRPRASIALKGNQSSIQTCPRPCRCRCHKRTTFALPSSLRNLIGALHITVANSRWNLTSCNVSRCRRQGHETASLHYTFP